MSHLSRRSFNRLVLAAGTVPHLPKVTAQSAQDQDPANLADTFLNPPPSAAPHTYWMWMNGNISSSGITADLETMKRTGIHGMYLYNCAVGIPRGPIDYGSPQWLNLIHHAVSEAARLSLTVAIHNAPGYSGTGGPWITPELSMQELVWSEVLLPTAPVVDLTLPQPRTRLNFYRDARVLAYPSLPSETALFPNLLREATANGQLVDKTILTSGDRTHKLRLKRQPSGQIGTLELKLSAPFTAQAIAIYRSPEDPIDPFDGPRDYPPKLTLQSSQDGVAWKDLCTLTMPALRAMNSPGVHSFSPTEAQHFRILSNAPTWITGLDLFAGPRLTAWAGKANGAPPPPPRSSQDDQAFDLSPTDLIDPSSVIDISAHMTPDGRLHWTPPAAHATQRWTIVRLGHTTTAETVAAAPDSGIGLECDKLSKAGVDAHFEQSLDPLFARLGPLVGTTLATVSIDSWEAGRGNWTAELPAYFLQSRHYDITPWLLTMTGRIVGSVRKSNQFLFDLRRTHAQMLAENYYAYYHTRLHACGLTLHAEPYGDGTFDSFAVAENLDLTMGEFWVRYTYGAKSYIDLVRSATHTLGQRIAACEAFTGAPLTSRWTGHPYALKAEGDRMFAAGVNRFVFHTFVHQPHPTAQPGMTMGPFGTHFDRNQTWMQPESAAMDPHTGYTAYLTRTQFLLQSAAPVADFCLLELEEPTSGSPDPSTGRLAVPYGYAADVVSPSAVLRFARVEQGRVTFAAGPSAPGVLYRAMILPPLNLITPTLFRRLVELTKEGMTLIASTLPSGSPSLEDQPVADHEIARLTDTLRTLPTFHLVNTLDDALANLNLVPDFSYASQTLGTDVVFSHRKLHGDDLYFVSNQRRRSKQVHCTFRATARHIELWDAVTGKRSAIHPVAHTTTSHEPVTRLTLSLGPAQSLFVLCRANSSTPHPIPGDPAIHVTSLFERTASHQGLPNNFTLTLWFQPETWCLPDTGFFIFPERPASQDHATLGLAAGQNGVFFYERSSSATRLILNSGPISGWTHLALTYRDGLCTLYLNGRPAGTAEPSRLKLQPPNDAVTPPDQVPHYFEGNSTPVVLSKPLNVDEIERQHKAGVPNPELGAESSVFQAIVGPWRLTLPGSPICFDLPALMSLNQHPELCHFAGTLTYATTFNLNRRSKSLFLDLGRLDVTARVRINGGSAGALWMPPYVVDITALVRPGRNTMEIDVTTLWPNRLIGDEAFPEENAYAPSGPILELPAWYRDHQPKPPGGRSSFATWHHYKADDPLLKSGLIGPVRLVV